MLSVFPAHVCRASPRARSSKDQVRHLFAGRQDIRDLHVLWLDVRHTPRLAAAILLHARASWSATAHGPCAQGRPRIISSRTRGVTTTPVCSNDPATTCQRYSRARARNGLASGPVRPLSLFVKGLTGWLGAGAYQPPALSRSGAPRMAGAPADAPCTRHGLGAVRQRLVEGDVRYRALFASVRRALATGQPDGVPPPASTVRAQRRTRTLSFIV
jgi:hypothetical protein